MFNSETYTARRNRLMETVTDGLILIMGNHEVGMNYSANPYHFRQDSNFLYYFGLDQPGLAAVLDPQAQKVTLFGDDLSLDDIVWMGPQPTMKDRAALVGVKDTAPYAELGKVVSEAKKAAKPVHYLPPYRYRRMQLLSGWLDIPVDKLKEHVSEELIRAVVSQRAHKEPVEIAEMEKALVITSAMHVAVMQAARKGRREAELAGLAEGISLSMGGHLAYPAILTINGQTLHNHYHGNKLESGQLVLGDFGAETERSYAGDITRTFPVDKKFTKQQKAIYEIVLKAEMDCIEACKPGVPYQEIHLQSARILAEGLKGMGLMQGDVDEAVAAGAHALFFPHGLGHMIGLDVHDMEDLGEQYVGYSDDVKRSEQFGTANLRLGRKLEPGFVLTVEPGIYFIPELIDQWKADKKHEDFLNYEEIEKFRNFSGVRIEDNVLITKDGHRVLGPAIPKQVKDVEEIRAMAVKK